MKNNCRFTHQIISVWRLLNIKLSSDQFLIMRSLREYKLRTCTIASAEHATRATWQDTERERYQSMIILPTNKWYSPEEIQRATGVVAFPQTTRCQAPLHPYDNTQKINFKKIHLPVNWMLSNILKNPSSLPITEILESWLAQLYRGELSWQLLRFVQCQSSHTRN